jgi:hypothetical protein
VGTVGGWKTQGKGEGGRIWWMYFVFMYENRTMKPVEIVLRGGKGNKGERWSRLIELRYIVITYVNVIRYPLYNYMLII